MYSKINRNRQEASLESNDYTSSLSGKKADHEGPVVEMHNISKQYKIGGQTVQALSGISLTVRRGEFVALVGASGSGKSTLLQIIGGLDIPTSGTVSIDGIPINKMSDRKLSKLRNETIGFVFQFFYLQPFLTLCRNIEIAALPRRTSRTARSVRAMELAKQVGLSERLDHLPSELSGGQIQRVAIARALFNQPRILIADEPTGNLDSQNGHDIIELFKNIRSTYGTTVIIATHDSEIAARADRIITIKDGVLS